MAFLGRWSVGKMGEWGRYAGGALLIVLGLLTILRGTGTFHKALGCHGPEVVPLKETGT
jgi:hypothetical protein